MLQCFKVPPFLHFLKFHGRVNPVNELLFPPYSLPPPLSPAPARYFEIRASISTSFELATPLRMLSEKRNKRPNFYLDPILKLRNTLLKEIHFV